MPFAPQTWTVAKAVQTVIQNELLVTDSLVTNASPFTLFSAGDAAMYGATNAIYVGFPKNVDVGYTRQCHVIPNIRENVYRRSLTGMSGGKTFDEGWVYVRFVYARVQNWYQAQQDIIAARDAFYPILIKHAQMPNAPTVEASRPDQSGASGFPVGQHIDEYLGLDWWCWGFVWWVRQEWTAQGGITV